MRITVILVIMILAACGEEKAIPFARTDVIGLSIVTGDKDSSCSYTFSSTSTGTDIVLVTIARNGMIVGPAMYWDINGSGVLQIRQQVGGPVVESMVRVTESSDSVTILRNGVQCKFRKIH